MTRTERKPPRVDATLVAALGRGAAGLSATVVDLLRYPVEQRRRRRRLGRLADGPGADEAAVQR